MKKRKRIFDTGRRDTMGRRIKDSGQREDPRRASAEKLIQTDFQTLADEYTEIANQAAHAKFRGNETEYNDLMAQATTVYALTKRWEFLAYDQHTRETEFAKWADAYGQFRRDAGLTAEKRNIGTVWERYNKRYVSMEHLQEVHTDIEEIFKETWAQSDPTEEEKQRYEDVTGRNRQHQRSQQENTEEPHRNVPPQGPPQDHPMPPRSGPTVKDIPKREGGQRRRKPQSVMSKSKGILDTLERRLGIKKFGGFRVSYRPHIGPFVLNFARNGLSSVSMKGGAMRYRVWSRDYERGFSSADLPGFINWRFSQKSKAR